MRHFLAILALAVLVRAAAAEDSPLMSGRWKIVSITGDYESSISNLRTMTFDNGKVDFQGDGGIWTAKMQIKSRADGTRQLLLDGPPELNGGDLSFKGSALLSFHAGLARVQWTSFANGFGDVGRKINVDMWIEKLPDIEKELQGEWSVVWSSVDGTVAAPASNGFWIFNKRDLRIRSPGVDNDQEYRITLKNEVVLIAFERWTGLTWQREKGILERRADGKLWIALSPLSVEPPTEFASRKGSRATLLILERRKQP